MECRGGKALKEPRQYLNCLRVLVSAWLSMCELYVDCNKISWRICFRSQSVSVSLNRIWKVGGIYILAHFSPVLQIISHHENVKNAALERISKSNTNFLVGFSNLQVPFCENSGRIMGYIPKVELSIKNSSKQKIVQVCEFC